MPIELTESGTIENKMELNFVTTLIKHDVNHNVKQCFKSKKPFGE